MDDGRVCLEKLKLLELVSAYTLTLDGKDAVGWAGCFTTDGVFGQADRVIRGRERLRAYAEIHGRIGTRHITSSPLFRVDADGIRATGRSTTVVTAATRRGYRIIMTGRYDDEFRKVGDDWFIARRIATVENLPNDPHFSMLAADPDVAEIVRPVLDAWRQLGERVT